MQCMEEDNLRDDYMVVYEGIFFDEENVKKLLEYEKEPLEKVIDYIHITFKFKPSYEEIFNDIVGKFFEIKIIGYACDGKNSGFEIEIPHDLKKYYIHHEYKNRNIPIIPHITTSISLDSKPVNTKNLEFIPLEKPVMIKGRFGYWINDNGEEYLSFEKYSNRCKW